MLKKIFLILAIVLLLTFLMPTAAFGATADYTVDKVDYTVQLLGDGSALISEDWTVTFSGKSDGFVREIMVPEDNFEFFTGIGDVSVSVDGSGCSEVISSSAVNGTYSFEKTDNVYTVQWYEASENESHVFSLRYVQTGAVKLYNERAYFFCTAVNKESGLICRNVTLSVKTPAECYAEDFEIVESDSLAGKKTDGAVVFTADNAAGSIKIGITMPTSLFDTQKLTVITDDYTAAKIVASVTVAAVAAIAGYVIYYSLNYRRIFRKRWEKKCRKKALDESSYTSQSRILNKIGAARILNIVTDETVSGVDMFTVNLLELIKRGYITVSAEGFTVCEKSDSDTIGRPLDKNDKTVMSVFGSGKWKKMIAAPEEFYEIVEKYNRNIGFASPIFALSSDGKKILRRCFELSLSAKRHEFVSPQEVSDDFFKNGKFTVIDLIISVLNEYTLAEKHELKNVDTEKYKRNMFMLRDIYENGKKIVEQKEFERMQLKKHNKKKAVADDDINFE